MEKIEMTQKTTTMQATAKMAANTIRAIIHGCNPQSGQVHVKPFILLIHVYESGHGEGLLMFHKYHLLNQLQVFMRYKKLPK
jgi:hypothetical protein